MVSQAVIAITPEEQLSEILAHIHSAGLGHNARVLRPRRGPLREQLRRFRELAEAERERHPGLSLHAANSAATLRGPEYHFDMVRCGVAVYGMDPFGVDAAARGLEPVMSLHSYVADVKRFATGQSAGYGRSWVAPGETLVGVIPIGYGVMAADELMDRIFTLTETQPGRDF